MTVKIQTENGQIELSNEVIATGLLVGPPHGVVGGGVSIKSKDNLMMKS